MRIPKKWWYKPVIFKTGKRYCVAMAGPDGLKTNEALTKLRAINELKRVSQNIEEEYDNWISLSFLESLILNIVADSTQGFIEKMLELEFDEVLQKL